VAENFPEECRYVLETLGGIWHHDALARKQELSPEERLRFHQEHSGPLMKTLHDWMEAQLAERKTEPNSGLGKAIRYMLRHWLPLTARRAAKMLRAGLYAHVSTTDQPDRLAQIPSNAEEDDHIFELSPTEQCWPSSRHDPPTQIRFGPRLHQNPADRFYSQGRWVAHCTRSLPWEFMVGSLGAR